MRILGFIILGLQISPVLGFRMRVKPAQVHQVFDGAAFREPAFTLWAVVSFFSFLGLYVPYFYIQLQTMENGTVTGALNPYLLPLLNGAGLFSRLVRPRAPPACQPFNAFCFSLSKTSSYRLPVTLVSAQAP